MRRWQSFLPCHSKGDETPIKVTQWKTFVPKKRQWNKEEPFLNTSQVMFTQRECRVCVVVNVQCLCHKRIAKECRVEKVASFNFSFHHDIERHKERKAFSHWCFSVLRHNNHRKKSLSDTTHSMTSEGKNNIKVWETEPKNKDCYIWRTTMQLCKKACLLSKELHSWHVSTFQWYCCSSDSWI